MQPASITLDVAGAKVTLPEATLTELWLAKLRQAEPIVARPAFAPPRIGAAWPEYGGIFAGIARGSTAISVTTIASEDSEVGPGADNPDHCLILGRHEEKLLSWDAAMDWAKGLEPVGKWSLPTRAEQAILFGNVPEFFAKEWYWSCAQAAGDAQYAWCQTFGHGLQGGNHKLSELRARAVRRVAL
jgi:hypothetical protein